MTTLRRALSSLKRRSKASAAALTPQAVTRFLFPSYDLRDWRALNLGRAKPDLVPVPVRLPPR